jgi:putative nucleotidyltransferase with HDIG domain
MPSSSPRSPDSTPGLEPSTGADAMRERFIEATRRAEIIALVNAAGDPRTLGRAAAEELCEVHEAEVAFVVDCGEGRTARDVIGLVGADAATVAEALDEEWCALALDADRATERHEPDALLPGTRSAMVKGHALGSGRAILIGVARTYEAEFTAPERALLESVATSIALALERLWVLEERERLIERLKDSFMGTAEALANALEAKDDYTASHAREIADLAVAVGRQLGMGSDELEDLRYGAVFHDIGKIAVPDAILSKPGPLTDEERRIIERHAEIGAQIIAPVHFLSGAVPIVRHDHERWDGEGYPDGLEGRQIPLGARIVFVVDAFHAMVSDRPYRAGLSEEEALAELRRCAGTQFDPEVVEAFLAVRGETGSSQRE